MNCLNSINSATLGSSQFSPKSITGLTNWYESTTGLSYYAANNYVYGWQDISGNGRNMTANTSNIANSPLYYSSGLNNFPSIGFKENTWGQALYAIMGSDYDELTFVAVVKSLLSSKIQNIVSGSFLAGQNGQPNMIVTPTRNIVGGTFGQGGASYTGNIIATTDTAYVMTCCFKRNTNNYAMSYIYQNYIGPNVSTALNNTATTGPFRVANVIVGTWDLYPDGSGPRTLMGNIASVIIYNRFITDSERIRLTTYLVSKWNITV